MALPTLLEHEVQVVNTFLQVSEVTIARPQMLRSHTAPVMSESEPPCEDKVLEEAPVEDFASKRLLRALPSLSRIETPEPWDLAALVESLEEPKVKPSLQHAATPDPWEWQEMTEDDAPKLRPPPLSPVFQLRPVFTMRVLMPLDAGKLETSRLDNKQLIRWCVDGQRLDSHAERILSPEFQLPNGPKSLSFRMVILAKETGGKHGAGFRKAKGQGTLEVKCLSSQPEMGDLSFRVSMGRGVLQVAPTIRHNFAQKTCCSLRNGERNDWDFKLSADDKGCEIHLEVEF